MLSVLTELLGAPETELGAGIARALDLLAAQLGGERIWLYHADPLQDLTAARRFVDIQAGCSCAKWPALPTEGADLIQPWRAQLNRGEVVHVASLAALEHSAPLRQSLARAGIAAFLLVPVLRNGALHGFLWAETRPEAAPCNLALLPRLIDLMLLLQDRRAAERQQSEAVQRLTSVLDALPELMFEVTAEGIYTGLCVGPRHLMACPPDQLQGVRMSDVMPEGVLDLTHDALRRVLQDGYVENVIYALDLAGGRFYFELCGARKEAERPGDPPTALFLVRDITGRHAMQSEILRLRHVVMAMNNLVIFVDLEQNISWANPAFERQSGWSVAEIHGRNFSDLVRCDESPAEVSAALELALAAQQPFSGQTVNQDRHGSRYWVDFNVLPLFSAAGELEGFVSIETDVTMIKAQEARTEAIGREAAAARLRLENAVNALPDAAVIFDSEERLVTQNPAFHKYFPELAAGSAPGDLLRDMFMRGIENGCFDVPKQGPEMEDWLEQQLDAYRQPNYADELELPDGRWLRRVHSRTADGGLIGIGIDITTRRRHIAALDAMNQELVSVLTERDEARRRLVSIMMGAQVGTWELDVSDSSVTIGGHWAQIIGRESDFPKTFSMDDLRELVHPDDVDRLDQDHFYGQDFGARSFEFEMRMRHRDGHWVWVMSRGQVIRRDADGHALHVVGVHLDISERKRLEREIEASQAHLSSAMESSVAAISLYDQQGRLLYCNAEANRIFQLAPGMISAHPDGHQPWVLEHLDGRPLRLDEGPYQRASAERVPVRDIKLAVRLPDGERRVLICNASPIDAGEGRVNVVISFWDITEQLNATDNLQRALERAEEMSRAKSVFLANMSHEIRTPLNGVLGLAEVLDMQITDPAQRRMIASIRQSGETLLAVLNSILDMSKIEAGKLELEKFPFTMRDVIGQIIPVYTIQAEEKGLDFEVFRSAGCDRMRCGDPHRIQQILHNLLSNALKFTADGSVTLDVSCRVGKPVVIEITDTGSGMTEEQSARAFDSFEQAEAGTTRRFGGTGLGLSIVRELVDMMHGKVTLDSAPGRGTVVRVVLPLDEAEAAPQALPLTLPETPRAAPSNTPKLRILGADDNATNRQVMAGMLGHTGADLLVAQNGQQALQLWQEAQNGGAPFDVVLLDIAMPVMDGPTTMRLIREAEAESGLKRSRIIAVSGQSLPAGSYDPNGAGFDGHLMKPFSLKELVGILAAE